MAIISFRRSLYSSNPDKYISFLTGNPAVMAAPTATDGGTGSTVSVAFTAQSGATSYTALSTPGSFTGTGASSPITVSGLTAGTAYTFQVRATNSVGTGAYSAASNSVTPAIPLGYESIATLNGDGSSTSLTFSSIPSTYKHLQIRTLVRNLNGVANITAVNIRFNGDTGSNYASSNLFGNGSSVSTQGNASSTSLATVYALHDGTLADCYAVGIIDIEDYASTSKNKTARTLSGANANTTTAVGQTRLTSGAWFNTNAITSITLLEGSGVGWTTATQFALYGIKG